MKKGSHHFLFKKRKARVTITMKKQSVRSKYSLVNFWRVNEQDTSSIIEEKLTKKACQKYIQVDNRSPQFIRECESELNILFVKMSSLLCPLGDFIID